MSAKTVKVVLNQQQLELLDNTVARGIAPDRESLIRMALKEFAAKHCACGRLVLEQTNRPVGIQWRNVRVVSQLVLSSRHRESAGTEAWHDFADRTN